MFKEKKEKIALFGGSFDPPHFGHIEIVEKALSSLDIDKIVVVPTYLNPFKDRFFLPPKERFSRLVDIFRDYRGVELCNFEIRQKRAVSTVETIDYLKERYIVKYIVVGADNLEHIDRWRDFNRLNREHIWAIATREGYNLEHKSINRFHILSVNANISSTEIRDGVYKY